MFDCDPASVIDQQLAAWRARDAEAFASHYAADAVMMDHPGVVTVSGRDAIQARYARSFATGPGEVVIKTRIVSGEYVIDDEAVSGTRGSARGGVVYRVQNCLITQADYLPFQSTPAVPEAAQ